MILHGPKITKRLTVTVSVYCIKHQLHGCTVTFNFLMLDQYLFGIKIFLENSEDPDQLCGSELKLQLRLNYFDQIWEGSSA